MYHHTCLKPAGIPLPMEYTSQKHSWNNSGDKDNDKTKFQGCKDNDKNLKMQE